MEQKSLRHLANELEISASYLSQVKNGKRPASQKVLSSVKQNVKQNGIIFSNFTFGGVSELADEHDLGLEFRSRLLTAKPLIFRINSSLAFLFPFVNIVT